MISDPQNNGGLPNGYFVNGHFAFQCASETHIFQGIGRSPVSPEGSSLFPTLSPPPVATFKGIFTETQSSCLQSIPYSLQASDMKAYI